MPGTSTSFSQRAFNPRLTVPETLALAALFTLPFDIRLTPFSLEGVRVPILLFEVPLIALSVYTMVHLLRRGWRPDTALSWLAVILALLLAVSVVARPSWFALLRLYRFAAAASLGYWILQTLRDPPRRTRLLIVTACTALFQSYLAFGQHLLGKGMGYSFLGEGDYLYGSPEGPRYAHGTLSLHHYLAGFTMATVGLLMQIWAPPRAKIQGRWLVVLGAAAIPIGLTFSRMGAVAWFLVVTALGIGCITTPRLYAGLLVSILLGGLVPALIGVEGWSARATETIEGDGPGGDDEGVDVGGRITMARQGIRVVRQHPILGTGIGRYLEVAGEEGADAQLTVHNVPLAVAAENGLPAGIITLALLSLFGIVAVRAGPLAMAVFAAYLPFLLLDVFPYADTQGIAISGLWMAAVLATLTSNSTG